MNNFFIVLVLLLYVLFLDGCARKERKRATLHNWPILSAKDCPVNWKDYDEEVIRKRAKELGIRPVDYLHKVNNRKGAKIGKWRFEKK